MMLEGAVVNCMVVLDRGARLPEGARVRVELADEDDDLFPSPEPYDKEMELAILREALEDVKAGRGMPVEEFMAELAAKYNFPPVPPE